MKLLQNGLLRLRDWLFYQKISRKISVIFFVFLLCSAATTLLLYRSVSGHYAAEAMTRSSRQTLTSLKSNVADMINTTDSNYDLLLKAGITGLIREPMSPDTRKLYDNYLFTLVDTYNHLESIYLTDLDHRLYGVDKTGIKSLRISSFREAPWYEEARKAAGSYLLSYDAGDIFRKTSSSHFISLIRVINDLETQQPVGFAILNLPTQSISDLFRTVFPQGDARVALYDGENRQIVSAGSPAAESLLSRLSAQEPYLSRTEGSVLTAGLYLPEYGWKLAADFPIREKTDFTDSLMRITFQVLLVNAVLMLLCAMLLSRSITRPIHRLIRTMQGVKDGAFLPVEVGHPDSEVGQLQTNYNLMISEIQTLIRRLVDEQKIKRQAELRALQEQIKPHFLYNTLDAIGCMALTDDPGTVYDAIETLGSFYRHSLSGGGQQISLREEVQIVRDYVSLLCLRYDGLFEIEYSVGEDALECGILRLLLQPLVENAVYHGIKPMGGGGRIVLSARRENGLLRVAVEDNGVGMDPAALERVKNGEGRNDRGGLGLAGTRERVRICYGSRSRFEIFSRKNRGTRIEIDIPAEPWEEEAPHGISE